MTRNAFRKLPFLMAIASLALFGMPASSVDQTDPNQLVPPAPTDITTFFLYNHVILTWKNVNAPAVEAFHIFRLENYSPDTTLKEIATVPHNVSTPAKVSYSDTTVLPSRTYTYFITSKTQFGVQSNNSKLATITTPAAFRR